MQNQIWSPSLYEKLTENIVDIKDKMGNLETSILDFRGIV